MTEPTPEKLLADFVVAYARNATRLYGKGEGWSIPVIGRDIWFAVGTRQSAIAVSWKNNDLAMAETAKAFCYTLLEIH